MKVSAANIGNRDGGQRTSVAITRIKSFIRKLTKLFTLDDSPIFKSRDWPHLWPK